MKHLPRRGRRTNLHILLGAELEETLEAGRRMLRSLPLVAVRQEQCKAAAPAPFGIAAADKLIDDDLGTISEVAELRLPNDQRSGLGSGIAVLETEHGLF